MTRVEIEAGACGFTARVEVVREARGLRVSIASDCEMVCRFGERLPVLPARRFAARIGENPVFRAADGCVAHPSCPVLVGVLKAVEVEAGVSLPAAVRIRFLDGGTSSGEGGPG